MFKWNELLSMYRTEKKRGLRVIYGKTVVGASDSCICPDCSDLLSLASGIGSQE